MDKQKSSVMCDGDVVVQFAMTRAYDIDYIPYTYYVICSKLFLRTVKCSSIFFENPIGIIGNGKI